MSLQSGVARTPSRFIRFFTRPFLAMRARWRHEWSWSLHRRRFELRHHRHLAKLSAVLGVATIVWLVFVMAVANLAGWGDLLHGTAFAQNVLASLLVLPVGVAVAVVAGTVLERYSLRFKVRHAADDLANGVSLAVFKLIVLLQRECAIPINLEGPVNHVFVAKARDVTTRTFITSKWKHPLPSNFKDQLELTVAEMNASFQTASDLRLAFPRAFDLIADLKRVMASIKSGSSSSDPDNTALIVLHYAARMLRDLR
jgi:hypothetical protein